MNCQEEEEEEEEEVCGPSRPVAEPEYVWDQFNQLYLISDGKLIKQSDPYNDYYMQLMQQGYVYNPAVYYPVSEPAMTGIPLFTGNAAQHATESGIARDSESAADCGQANEFEASRNYGTSVASGVVWNSETTEKVGTAEPRRIAKESVATDSGSRISGKTATGQMISALGKESETGRELEALNKTGSGSNCDVRKSGTVNDSEIASRKSEIAAMLINRKKLVKVESALEFLTSSPRLTLSKVSDQDCETGPAFTKSLSELSRALKSSSRTSKLDRVIPKYPLNAVSKATVQTLTKRLSKISKGDLENAGPELFVLSRKGAEIGKEGREEKTREGASGNDDDQGQGYLLFRLHSSNGEEDESTTTPATTASTHTTKTSTTSGSTASSSSESNNDDDNNCDKKDHRRKKCRKSKKHLTTEESSEYDDEYDDDDSDSDDDDDYDYSYDYDDDYDYEDYSDSSSPRLLPGQSKGHKVRSSSSGTSNVSPMPNRTIQKKVGQHPAVHLEAEAPVLPPRVPNTIQIVPEEEAYNRSNKNANNYLINQAVLSSGQAASSAAEYVGSERDEETDQGPEAVYNSCVEHTGLMRQEPEEWTYKEDNGSADASEENDVQNYYDRRMTQYPVYDPQDDNPVNVHQEWQWQRPDLCYDETTATRSPESYERYEMQMYHEAQRGTVYTNAVGMVKEEEEAIRMANSEAMRMAHEQSMRMEEEESMGTIEGGSMRAAELETRPANDSHYVELNDGRRSTEFVEITAKAIAFPDGKYEIVDVDVVPLKPYRPGPTQRAKNSASRSVAGCRTKRTRRRAPSSKRIPMTSSNETTTITQHLSTDPQLRLAPPQIHPELPNMPFLASQQNGVTSRINHLPLQTARNDVSTNKVNEASQQTTSATQTDVMTEVDGCSVAAAADISKVMAESAQTEVKTARDSCTQTRTLKVDVNHHQVTCDASIPSRSPLHQRHPPNPPSAYLCQSPIPPPRVTSDASLVPSLPLRSTCDQVQQTDRLEPDQSSSHLVKYGRYVYSLYQQDQLTDVVLKVGMDCFYAHRSVLACHSRYFASVFTQDLVSSSSSSGPSSSGATPDIIEINDISPVILKKILEYIYTGRISLHQSFLLDILTAASKLELPQLETTCIKKLNALHPQELLDALISVYEQGIMIESDLIDKLWHRIARHFKTVILTKQFLQMNVDCICRLLSDDDLVLTSEIDVAHAAIRWINEDREKRVPVAGKVLAFVRFKNLTPDELVSFGRLENYILSDPAVKDAILEANWYHTCQLGRTDAGMMSSVSQYVRQKPELRAQRYSVELPTQQFIAPNENWRN